MVPTTDAIHRNIICDDWVDHPLQKSRYLHARRSEERKAESRQHDDDCFTCELSRISVTQLCHFDRNRIVTRPSLGVKSRKICILGVNS